MNDDKALNQNPNVPERFLGMPNVRVNFKKSDSSSKEFAFMKAHELNNIEKFIKIPCDLCNGEGSTHSGNYLAEYKCPKCMGYGHYYEKNIWRTGKNTMKQLIVETDNPSKENLSLIINHLNKLFGYKFNVIKTLHGYHIIGTEIYPSVLNKQNHKEEASIQWIYANSVIINNKIQTYDEMQEIVSNILDMDQELREYQYSSNYKELFTTALKNSGLLNCVGDFDILYTVLSLKYGKSTLRISKKQDNDRYEEITI